MKPRYRLIFDCDEWDFWTITPDGFLNELVFTSKVIL